MQELPELPQIHAACASCGKRLEYGISVEGNVIKQEYSCWNDLCPKVNEVVRTRKIDARTNEVIS